MYTRSATRGHIKSNSILAYCDDLIIISDSYNEANNITQELNRYTETVGLRITPDPKKTIIMSNRIIPIKIELEQSNKKIEIKEDKSNNTNKYLGIFLNIDLDWTLSIIKEKIDGRDKGHFNKHVCT